MALHDPLTGLCNRGLLEDRFDVNLQKFKRDSTKAPRSQTKFAMLFIDLDHFKTLNDTYGHLVGDSVLIFVAHALMTCARKVDTVARIGGDEFAVLLANTNRKEDVEKYCNRVRTVINQGKKIDGLLLKPALSNGASFFPAEATDFETLTANADKAMYHAKQHEAFLAFYADLRSP